MRCRYTVNFMKIPQNSHSIKCDFLGLKSDYVLRQSHIKLGRIITALSFIHLQLVSCVNARMVFMVFMITCGSVTDISSTNIDVRAWINREWCMYLSDELFQLSREGYFDVNFPSCEATREINTKITLKWAQKQFVASVHTLFYFLHDITNQ